jgi:hypothetical protein
VGLLLRGLVLSGLFDFAVATSIVLIDALHEPSGAAKSAEKVRSHRRFMSVSGISPELFVGDRLADVAACQSRQGRKSRG